MSAEKHNKLIDHIRESLQEHEEPYSPGAWKAFQQHSKRKGRGFAWKAGLSIAASLALVLSVMFALKDFVDPAHEQTATEHQEEKRNTVSTDRPNGEQKAMNPASETSRSEDVIYAETIVKEPEPTGDSGTGDEVKAKVHPPAMPRLSFSGVPRLPTPALLASATIPGPPVSPAMAEHPETDVVPLPYQEFRQRRVVKVDQDKNFSLGLAYAPLLNGNDTRTDWSMGGGLYTEWKFARNLALSSGILIAQNQLEYDHRETAREMAGAENLAYIQVDLVSLEIPLSLRYYLTDHISVSAGISSAAFLRENYDYTYQYQREIQILNYTEHSGIEPVSEQIMVTEAETQTEPSLNSMKWAAFYTFSFGYQYDMADKHTLSLEPFIKLPSGHLTTRNIKYYTGGVQLRFSF